MMIIGHRGAAELAPENTLKSIQAGLDSKVDMIEIDIAICKTGEIMVIHDDTVNRCTNGTGYICDLEFNYLRTLDAGEGEIIPTLQEVIDLIDGRIPLNIEIKGKGSSHEVAKILKNEIKNKGRYLDNFIVSSFDHIELVCFNKLYPLIKICPLISCIPINLAAMAEEMGAWSLNISREFISQELVNDAHKRGIKILVYTVNEPEDFVRIKKFNVDGVFTNNRLRLLDL